MAAPNSDSADADRGFAPPVRGVHCWLTVPLAMCALGVLCFAIDIPVAAYFQSKALPKIFREILDVSETFGHAAGVILIIIALAVVDRIGRPRVGLLLAGSLGGGLMADLIKLFILRTRPRNLDLAQTTVWETFGPWLAFVIRTDGDSHSFPSAHTATAFGFAVVLSAIYPRGRRLFFIFACLTGLHRMECSAHFASDVCFGAAVGWVFGNFVLHLATKRRSVPAVADGGL
jgi:membrane-associated phospholipid phosphatase